jgi:GGDEF domain-containing protein
MNAPANRLNPETGLYTRETLDFLFSFELARIRRYPSPLALLHLGLCLDALPDASQAAIAQQMSDASMLVAHVLNSNLRESDIPAHDGEDFLILLPETDISGGKAAGLRLLLRLSETRLTGLNVAPTACIGMASHPGGQVISAETLLGQAHAGLRAAHRRGPFSLVAFNDLGQV